MVRKKLESREYKVQCEGMVTGWLVLILEIGLKIYWDKRKIKHRGKRENQKEENKWEERGGRN
jgi:hypothetical protein